MANAFNLEFNVNTEQGQQAMERMLQMQNNYADALRQTVRETLNLSASERITQQHITKLQKLIQLERQRQQLARDDYRQAVQHNRQLSQLDKQRALQRIQDEERVAQARAVNTDEMISQGSSTLIRQEQAAAKQANASIQQMQLGHFEGSGSQNMVSAIAGASGSPVGSAISLLAKGGSAAKFGLAGLAAGLIFGGIKKLWNAGMDRDEALQSVLAATQGRYASEPNSIKGSNAQWLSPEAYLRQRQIDFETRYGSAYTVKSSGLFKDINGSMYLSREAFDLYSTDRNSSGNLLTGRHEGSNVKESDLAGALTTVYNKDVNFWHSAGNGNETYYAAKAIREAAESVNSSPNVHKPAIDRYIAEGKTKDDYIRDIAYRTYTKDIKDYQDSWGITKVGRWLLGNQRGGISYKEREAYGTEEVNERYKAIKAEEEMIAKRREVARQEEEIYKKNAKLAAKGEYGDQPVSERFRELGMSKTEALKYISVAVQAMPNLRNISEEGFHLAMYSRAGFGEDEVARLNKYYDSGQQVTGGQIFSMLRRELTKSSEDLPAVRKYMEGFQQLLPQVISQRATYSGAEASELISTMKSIQDSFAKYGTTAFSGTMLAGSMSGINQSYKDRSNDWKETILYRANETSWNQWISNPNNPSSPFNPNSDNYNAALDLYRRNSGGQFSFLANNMMREGGIFDNQEAVKNVNKYLGQTFGNDFNSLIAAVQETYTKTQGENGWSIASLIANEIKRGNYDLFTDNGPISKEYLEIDPHTLDPQKLKADFEDSMADLGAQLVGMMSSVVQGLDSIVQWINRR